MSLIQEWHMGKDVILPMTAFVEYSEKEIINALAYIGEEIVNKARLHGTYQDQTGNLRASIWYGVYKDGKRKKLSIANTTAEAKISISEQIDSLLSTVINEEGIILVVGAGMEYAAAVESNEYDVITGSVLGKQQFEQALRELL